MNDDYSGRKKALLIINRKREATVCCLTSFARSSIEYPVSSFTVFKNRRLNADDSLFAPEVKAYEFFLSGVDRDSFGKNNK